MIKTQIQSYRLGITIAWQDIFLWYTVAPVGLGSMPGAVQVATQQGKYLGQLFGKYDVEPLKAGKQHPMLLKLQALYRP